MFVKEKMKSFIVKTNTFVSGNTKTIIVATILGTIAFRNYTFYKYMMKKADHTFEYICRMERTINE